MEISSPTTFEIEGLVSKYGKCPYEKKDCENCFWDCSDEDDEMVI